MLKTKAASPLDDFDPNRQDKLYATYCPGRYNGGTFKTHLRRQDMTSAMNRHKWRGAVGYQHIDGKWVEIVRMEPCSSWDKPETQPWLPDACERCHWPTVQPTNFAPGHYRHGTTQETGEYEFVRKGSKLAEPLAVEFLCPKCR